LSDLYQAAKAKAANQTCTLWLYSKSTQHLQSQQPVPCNLTSACSSLVVMMILRRVCCCLEPALP
jgi:hypothetical protein